MSELLDLAEHPTLDSRTTGLHSVSSGKVKWHPRQKAVCVNHGAMNCVRVDEHGKLWRCQHAVAGVIDGPVINLCDGAGFQPRD